MTKVIKDLAIDPYTSDIQKMKGERNVWRRRIGSYRLFYNRFAKTPVSQTGNVGEERFQDSAIS